MIRSLRELAAVTAMKTILITERSSKSMLDSIIFSPENTGKIGIGAVARTHPFTYKSIDWRSSFCVHDQPHAFTRLS